MIILDTNVVSELMRPRPNRQVARWISSQPASSLFTTAITEAEIRLGVALLPRGKRREALQSAVTLMFAEDFEDRVLPFGSASTSAFADLVASRRRGGRPISHADAQIAAIARCHGAAVATRNTADFEGCDLKLVNPWER
ncbi:MAG: type II toxin-antitoxin system VapC family toxin [bacterium]